MNKCSFCKRRFINKKAVFAHLRFCKKYPKNKPKAETALLKAKKTGEAEISPAAQMRERVLAERLRLELRQAEAENRRLDDEEREATRTAKEAEERERRRALDRERAKRESLLVEKRQEEMRQLAREKIQKAKDAAFGVLGSWDVPKAAKAEAVVAVERALSGFPVYDLPQGELDEIAAGVRDRVYAPYKRIQKQREEEAAGRRQIEADRRAQKFALTLKKSVLVSYALSYARQEWEIDFLDWSEVEREILAAVDRELSGDESEADVRDLVDRVVGG